MSGVFIQGVFIPGHPSHGAFIPWGICSTGISVPRGFQHIGRFIPGGFVPGVFVSGVFRPTGIVHNLKAVDMKLFSPLDPFITSLIKFKTISSLFIIINS